MIFYRLKWLDGLTAVVMIYHEGDPIETMAITGMKVRLAALAEIKSVAELDAKLHAFAKIQNVELIKRVS